VTEPVKKSVFRRFSDLKIVSFILHGWFIALILGTLTFFLLQIKADPYVFTLVDSSSFVPDPGSYKDFYLDLNSDGTTERFHFSNIGDSSSCLLVTTSTGGVLEQWNFKGRFSSGLLRFQKSDYNHDGNIELAAVTLEKNIIYLNIIEPFGGKPILIRNRALDTVRTNYGPPFMNLDSGLSEDLNSDGYDEIIFTLSPFYARQPRKVYAFDIRNDQLSSSPYAGSVLWEIIKMDADKDGVEEFVGKCHAPNNYIDEIIPLQDSSSWFIVLDEHMNFKVPPQKLGPQFSVTTSIILPSNDSICEYVSVTGYRDTIPIFDWYRILPDYSLKKQDFPFNRDSPHPYLFAYPAYSRGGVFYNRYDKVLFINERGKVFTNRKFSRRVIPVEVLNPNAGIKEFEYAFLVDGRILKISFFSLEGKELGSIPNVNYSDLNTVSWVGKVNGHHQLFIGGNTVFYWYEVRQNHWQYLRYILWMLLIVGYYGFIELIKFGQAQEIKKGESLRREILELQLKSVNNQLDPHFTFNALNGLSYLALAGETDKVNHFINQFSRLLRTHLHASDQTLVRLRNEISFLENYMELQQMRFEDRIKLELNIHPEVDTQVLVPKMILQTHVENAVKHGLQPMLNDESNLVGVVRVTISNKRESILIVIEDNGVGRGNGMVHSHENTGKGLQVLEQIFSSVRQLYKIRITQEFEDLKNEKGEACGTRVEIVIR